jgi:alkylation response protein AidB-like acyl-CoA dehydrogenase
MDFNLTEEQRMWRDAVHDFVTREVKPKAREVDELSLIHI